MIARFIFFCKLGVTLSMQPGDERPRGEAGRPPIGRPAWGWRPWPASGDGENAAISIGSKILTLLEEVDVYELTEIE